jgi:hypothetical protein
MCYNLYVDPKPRPNEAIYLEILRRMTPGERLRRACELSDFTKQVFRSGLKHRFPDATPGEVHRIYLDELAKCHNSNY